MTPEAAIKKTTHLAASTADNIEKNAGDMLENGRKAFNKVVDQVGPAAKTALTNVEDSVESFFDAASKTIRKNPVQSLLIGLGVGALLGALLRGRRAYEN